MNTGLFALLLGWLGLFGLNGLPAINAAWPRLVRQLSLGLSVSSLFLVLQWWYRYEPGYNGFQLVGSVYNLSLGLDGISLWLVLLTAIILPISLLANWNSIREGQFNLIVLLLGGILLVNYLCIDLLSFYVLFEASLIPLFILLGVYGAGKKERAAYYVMIFTFTGSLFLLLSLVVTSYLLGTTSCLIYSQFVLSVDLQMLLWLGVMLGVMVKTPLFPFHVWLPVVHSESPLAGSVILAGLILKLTVYLILRWVLPFLAEASVIFYPLIAVICVLTVIYTSLTTLAQIDLKVIIAYSSIGHMGVCILGAFANNVLGVEGSYLLSLSHGFISPGLFIAVGGILYDRYHTRVLLYFQGLLAFMPVFAFYLIVLSFANIGTPLSGNFLGEFMSLTGAFQRSPIFAALASFSILLSAAYQMKLTSRLTGGVKAPYLQATQNLADSHSAQTPSDITSRESVLMLTTILPCLLIGIYPNFILQSLHWNLSSVIYFC